MFPLPQTEPKCLSVEEQLNKLQPAHMKECCGAIKKKTGQQAPAHKDLYNIVLTGIMHTELRNGHWDIRLCNTHSYQDRPHFLQTCFNTQVYILTKQRNVVTQRVEAKKDFPTYQM